MSFKHAEKERKCLCFMMQAKLDVMGSRVWMDSRIGYYVSLRGHGFCHRGLDNLCKQEAEDGGGRVDGKGITIHL